MNKISLLFVLICFSCSKKIEKDELKNINGYWEIKSVKTSDGASKQYKVNETIDYFEIKKNKGFRQKVMPQFDGKFLTNGVQEEVTIIEKNNEFYLEYKTKYGKWRETLITISDSTMELKNVDNTVYNYKRFVPFSLK
ncbi:hypothetical protein GCM10011508_12250 [Flavobacterium lutivivi]|jgi:hypothetical protein|nr:hypothetical protein GCM10011508_12250 [Flavobacterium lutivivi]